MYDKGKVTSQRMEAEWDTVTSLEADMTLTNFHGNVTESWEGCSITKCLPHNIILYMQIHVL